jgi:hypothetical protein
MAAQTYDEIQQFCYIALSQGQTPYDITPPDFAAQFPPASSYAEGRMYRDLVLLATRTQDTSLITVAGSRTLNLTAMTPNVVIVPEGFGLIYPAGTTNPALGTVIPFDKASLDVIDEIWPQQSVTMDPSAADWIGRFWALQDDHTLVFAPTVSGLYTPVITGLYVPEPMGSDNQTTYLTTNYPEALQALCMVFLSGGLQRNFGAASDDPKAAVSWEAQYQALLPGMRDQEARIRGLKADDLWPQQAPAQTVSRV